MNFVIHSLNRFVFFLKCFYTLLVSLSQVPYMQISGMILGVNIFGEKVSVASVIGTGGFGGVLRPQWRVLGGGAPYENF